MNRASRNRRNSCADGEVCSIRVMTSKKMLATVGIVRDQAQTAQLDRSKRHMSGNPTYPASRISRALNGPILSILNELSQIETRTR